ncbi:putative S-layer protein [Pleurocapsa sp. PCC 7327]|uniref:iron uptake porin n=1 Tax=Pleurocapsa sp. PCC 7327 TaxID=118163 RepID=UPI00029F91E2|nr:iron uptake porin [Pleurocapsa sp. PCC 7327]AFY77831.1 putative S-layer protein [Pleurocapsa sp. PCC 7327]
MTSLRKLGQYGLLGLMLLGSIGLTATNALADAIAPQSRETPAANADFLQQLDRYNNQSDSLDQVTSVQELKDVAPTEWAYEALRSLVERYGCIVGYPDSTYRGNRALTRWEFAAGLNSCMNTMERLIQENVAVLKEDVDTLKRLAQEFEAELAALGGRVDNLEGRVAFLEDNQFSTTTKLTGEVVFAVAAATNNGGTDNQAVFQNRTRLYLETSFTGEDILYTGLAAGNSPRFDLPSQGTGVPTGEGIFTFQDYFDNDVAIDFLSYFTPIGDWAEVFVTAAAGATSDYLPTAGNDPIDDGGDGGSGALTLFGAHNPIYYIGGGAGAGFNLKFGDTFTLSTSYLAGPADAASPAEGAGIFNGDYAALGQLTITPNDSLTFVLTYVNSYHSAGTPIFNYGFATFPDSTGVVGTSFANFPGGTDARVSANSFGVGASYRVAPQFVVSAWGGYTIADIRNFSEDGEIWNYALSLAFPDLFGEGNLGGLIAGVQPYLGNPAEVGLVGASNNIPIHIEAFYRYQLNDNISITPGIVYLNAPDQQDDEDAILGVVRTTFTF